MRFRVAALLAALVFATGASAADPKQERADYERELESVKALGAALQSDPRAATPAVRTTLDTVAARRKEAAELAAVGEYGLARSTLHEGYVVLTRTLASVKAGDGAPARTGSAAVDTGSRDMSGMSAEQKASAIASQLRTAKTLRDAYARKSKEKGIDAAATLARIDQLAADARALEGSDPSRALHTADEAYRLAKSSLEAARANP